MKKHIVKIKSIEHINHDVLQIVTEKPGDFNFIPGQATEVAINKNPWQSKLRPFTLTCLPYHDYLEFIIKVYPLRKSVTNELLQLKKNDELILQDVFGAIAYKNEGLFIAGGAGVTPFICIFRDLQKNKETGGNKLILANKTKSDIILKYEFENLLGNHFINILSEEKTDEYEFGMITERFLKPHIEINQNIYVCGPPPMMKEIFRQLEELKVAKNLIIHETF